MIKSKEGYETTLDWISKFENMLNEIYVKIGGAQNELSILEIERNAIVSQLQDLREEIWVWELDRATDEEG